MSAFLVSLLMATAAFLALAPRPPRGAALRPGHGRGPARLGFDSRRCDRPPRVVLPPRAIARHSARRRHASGRDERELLLRLLVRL
jgi:hypothetical protein